MGCNPPSPAGPSCPWLTFGFGKQEAQTGNQRAGRVEWGRGRSAPSRLFLGFHCILVTLLSSAGCLLLVLKLEVLIGSCDPDPASVPRPTHKCQRGPLRLHCSCWIPDRVSLSAL